MCLPNHCRRIAIAAIVLTCFAIGGLTVCGEDAKPVEITIKGNVLSNTHTGEKEKKVFILAYSGTPEIAAEFDRIMAEYYPDKGLDADAARKLQEQFMTRLTYAIDGPLVDAMHKEAMWTVRGAKAVTGVVSVREGQKWITATKWAATTIDIPAKMRAADKPFVMPDKEPLVLKITNTMSVKCICVPAGKFLMGEPYYQIPHWQEDPPHWVTLTKPYYLSECPISQDVYEAVMGNNPSKLKGATLPVHNVSCVDMYKFCQLLGEKTGKTIRVPSAAEWEYAARVGTSNPTYPERYVSQNSNADNSYASPPLPVKSKAQNAWGFYDMHSGWWERVSDAPVLDHQDTIDPRHTPEDDKDERTRAHKHQHVGKGQWTYAISEIEYIGSEAGQYRFRILVEE